MLTRRELLAWIGVSPACLRGQAPAKKAASWPVCVHSKALAQLGYAELGEIAKDIGFDGVDLTVMPGGHVAPAMAPVDLVRAIESVHGAGLVLPMISTALTTASDPWCRTLLALSGRSGVGLFKPGVPRHSGGVTQVRREYYGLSLIGRAYGISPVIPAGLGESAFGLAQVKTLMAGGDTQWAGLALSSTLFAREDGLSDEDFRELAPRVRSLTIQDFHPGDPLRWCPLGEGAVDFRRMFSLLPQGGFDGALSLSREYAARDEPDALRRDLEFLRKQIAASHQS